jgi:radical SAM superfamily enzyme YgiQ (UPF0313 family)
VNIVLPTLHVRRSVQAVPLAAACLAAALPVDARKEVHLLDLFPDQSDEAMAEEILSHSPELVAFPVYLWNREKVLSLARRLKGAQPSLWVLAGGPEATADAENLLREQGLDAVIRGEGEETFREMVQDLERGEGLKPLPGITLRGPQGILSGPDRDSGAVFAAHSSPWLTGVLTPQPGQGVLWETSRGCPFGCDFCFDARGSRGVGHLPPERLEAELDLFVRCGVSQVWILDSTFNFPPERGKSLLRLLAEKAPHIHFHLEAKADFLDRETARLLAGISCSVQIGLQSVRAEVLRNIHRSLDPGGFRQKMHLLSAEGVIFGLDLIYGLPGDDYSGFCESLDFALEFAPNQIDLFPLAVLPGTTLHGNRLRHSLRAQEEPPYEILESATWSPADLARSRRLAAAADIFYNAGRAVGFFSALLRSTGRNPVSFLEEFALWALGAGGVAEEHFLNAESWEAGEVNRLQEAFISQLFEIEGRHDLLPAAMDLIRYHYHFAETLLGEDTAPAPPELLRDRMVWDTPWRMAPTVRMVSFSYEILDFLETGGIDLEQFSSMFRPVGSVALFFRRNFEVFCESLEEDFFKLLQGSDGKRSPGEIFAGSISRREGEEIVEFAVAEGFLIP